MAYLDLGISLGHDQNDGEQWLTGVVAVVVDISIIQ